MTVSKTGPAIYAAARIAAIYGAGARLGVFKSELLSRGVNYDTERVYANHVLSLAVQEFERVSSNDRPDQFHRTSRAKVTAVRQ